MARALIISGEGFEDTELLYPYYRLREAGFEVDVASPGSQRIRGKHGYEVDVGVVLREVDPARYDLLVLPGGKAPAELRKDTSVLDAVRAFFKRGRPVAAICHGPQILVTAGLIIGRRATCYEGVADELKRAGAQYEDSEVVVDGNLITSRRPADLPAFMREVMRAVQ